MERPREAPRPVGGAAAGSVAVFVVATAAGAIARSGLAGSPVPVPGSPGVAEYFAAHPVQVLVSGAAALVAAAALAVLGVAFAMAMPLPARTRIAHWGAVVMLGVAGVGALVLAVLGSVLAPAGVQGVYTLTALAGGVLHVATLGLYLALLARSYAWSPAVRVLGAIAGWFAVACLLTIGVRELAAVTALAWVACLLWLVVAAHQVAFRQR
ncbi:hypothetical protein [Ruania alba]|uniref:DUF998 domain-containing protein n=1 Tax=Ruania alba TaxID=648782 RepID=A0A1H5L9K2_9MICO|nr:hypothetical protein [Ruania alba]SEE72858.1 hypothetical protein SAMN04488554_2651 [Ruania alba]